MGLESPFSLLGLSFIAVLVAFYFLKKQFEDLPISTLFLWKEVTQSLSSDKWWRRLQNQPLLWLQLLAMLFLVLALVNPFLNTHRFISSSRAVIIIDTSASMAASADQQSKETKFDQAKVKAIDLVKHLPNGAEVTVIDGKETPQIILSRSTNKTEAVRDIRGLSLSYQHEDFPKAVQLAESVGRDADLFLFSDHLKSKIIPKDSSNQRTITVTNVGKSVQNVSIQTFGVRNAGKDVYGIITIHNYMYKKMSGMVRVTDLDGKVLQEIKVEAPAREALTIQVKGLPKQNGYLAKWAKSDDAQYDNQAAAFPEEQENPVVYLAGDFGPFIPKALEVLGYHSVTETKGKSGQYTFNPSGGPSVFILSGVPSSDWPKGPKFVWSPKQGGAFRTGAKVALTESLKGVNDPLLQYIDASQIYLKKAYPSNSSLQTVLSSGSHPIVQKGNYKGDPIILMLFDLTDSDWPLHPSFPIFIKNAMEELLKGSGQLGIARPGENMEVQWMTSTTSAMIEDHNAKKVMNVPLTRNIFQVPSRPGLYYLQETISSGADSRPFAVQTLSSESDVSHGKSFQITGKAKPKKLLGKVYLSHWMVLLAFALLIIEWEVYRRYAAH